MEQVITVLEWALVVVGGFVGLIALFFVLFLACEIALGLASRLAAKFGKEI